MKQEIINTIKDKQWYHQRFDGCPQFILIISEAELKKEKRKFNWGHATSHWGFFADDRCDWYIDEEDIKNITGKFISLCNINKDLSQIIIKKWKVDEDKFYKYCEYINRLDLTKLDDDKLKRTYFNMLKRSINSVTSSSLIDGFALGADNYLAEGLNNFLLNKNLIKESHRYFAVLTAPTHQSFITQAEVDLLKIGLQIVKNKQLNAFLHRNSYKDIKLRLKGNKLIWKKLLNHQKHYFWSRNNYVDNNVLSIDFFIKEIIAIIKQKVDLKKEIIRLQSIPKKNKKDKLILLKQLKLPQILRNLLIISENFTWWQDERKRKTYYYVHYLSLILEEIGRRFGYSLHEMKYVFYNEIEEIFEQKLNRVTKEELHKRKKFCFWYQQGDKFDYISGSKAKFLFKKLTVKKTIADINDFRGMTACKGVAKGRVKIVKSVKECHKVKNGDILVAVMTRPDYVGAMRKAVAVITNEGGVTCHAAIVSRELGIPCIIGTKIATEVLKDGDMVEVNANHGVVTIIK